MSNVQLIKGDCIEVMKKLPDCSIDLIVTDPPYKTTARGVACVNTNRDFIGIELDDHYFEIAQSRIKEAEAENN